VISLPRRAITFAVPFSPLQVGRRLSGSSPVTAIDLEVTSRVRENRTGLAAKGGGAVMSRTFWLVWDGGKRSVSPPAAVRQEFRADTIEVEMFSVGEGETILISRGANVVMIDGGSGPRKPTNDELADLLAGRIPHGGLRAIIASHPHQDHTNAHRAFDVRLSNRVAANARYFDNANPRSTRWFDQRRDAVPGLPFTRRPVDDDPSTDSNPEISGLGAVFHHLRSTTGASSELDQAYWSVFTVMRFNDAVFLFTGDAHKQYEASLIPRLQQLVNRIHVLKVTHHGSSSGTSPDLIQTFRPALAFASTDAHHTHRLEADVRARLGDAAIYTTHDPSRPVHKAKDIVIRTDGRQRTIDGTQGVMFEVWRRQPALRPLASTS